MHRQDDQSSNSHKSCTTNSNNFIYTTSLRQPKNKIPEQLLLGNKRIEDTVLAECDAVHVRYNRFLMAKIKKQKKLIELNTVLLK